MLIIYYLKNYKTEQIGSHYYKNDINMYVYMYTHVVYTGYKGNRRTRNKILKVVISARIALRLPWALEAFVFVENYVL